MAYYVGLDVSVKETSICIMDDKGVVAARTDVSTDPDLIAQFISKHASEVERVVHESGILAIWLTRELEKRGVPIICIDARLAHKALSGRINKSDQGDAEGLAQLARTGWFTQVHIRSEASERVRVLKQYFTCNEIKALLRNLNLSTGAFWTLPPNDPRRGATLLIETD